MVDKQQKNALRELAKRIRGKKDHWLYPAELRVEGFLGTGPIFIVGIQPSTSNWEYEHPHRRAFYDLLTAEGAGNCHLTDLYKRRGLSGEMRKGLPWDFSSHMEIFLEELQILNPTAILALGWDACRLLREHTPELTNCLSRVLHFGVVRHGRLKEFQASLREGIKKARRTP